MKGLGLGFKRRLASLFPDSFLPASASWFAHQDIEDGLIEGAVDTWIARMTAATLDAFTANRPVFGTINSIEAVECAVGDSMDDNDDTVLLGTTNGKTELWVFAILEVKAEDAANRNIFTFTTGSSTYATRAALVVDDSVAGNVLQAGGRHLDADSYGAAVGTTDLFALGPCVVSAHFDVPNNTVTTYINGVLEKTDTTWVSGSVETTWPTTDSLDINYGDDNLTISDTIIVPEALTSTQIAATHAFLAKLLG